MLLFIIHSLNIYSVIEVEEQDVKVTNMFKWHKLKIGDIDISKGSGDQYYCIYIRGRRRACLIRKSIIAACTHCQYINLCR